MYFAPLPTPWPYLEGPGSDCKDYKRASDRNDELYSAIACRFSSTPLAQTKEPARKRVGVLPEKRTWVHHCQDCPADFKTVSLLRLHQLKHDDIAEGAALTTVYPACGVRHATLEICWSIRTGTWDADERIQQAWFLIFRERGYVPAFEVLAVLSVMRVFATSYGGCAHGEKQREGLLVSALPAEEEELQRGAGA
ncbi:hypothetical protein BV898_00280 [Hypsibius exemplaris]|uniref:C2H2-type domain-containing protein n=1 Tax=Hypsibius exemplaris TaxID=2072580 RepID=A0A1W0XFI0_HYPEX|nr:hypothetical protein BV898_00280 [Hypsibius exemplaris]